MKYADGIPAKVVAGSSINLHYVTLIRFPRNKSNVLFIKQPQFDLNIRSLFHKKKKGAKIIASFINQTRTKLLERKGDRNE